MTVNSCCPWSPPSSTTRRRSHSRRIPGYDGSMLLAHHLAGRRIGEVDVGLDGERLEHVLPDRVFAATPEARADEVAQGETDAVLGHPHVDDRRELRVGDEVAL